MGLEDLFKTVRDRFKDKDEKSSPLPETHKKPEIPGNLLFKCPRCRATAYMEEFEKNRKVCAHCDYHSRLTWRERLDITADKGSFREFDGDMVSMNPIGFPDYEKKISRLSCECKTNEAVVTGECTIQGYRAVIGIMDSHFMMASMGSVVGEKITRLFEYATERKLPVIIFAASGGARMQEGIISLMQMAKTSGAIARHNEARQLYITVLTDPTTGGVTASFASLGDVIIAEPKALIGFAGRRVIQDTIKQHLPDDFQSAEFLLENGFVDMITDRKRMRKILSRLLKVHNYRKQEE
ncbi:MAG: acetyl-CoA carboxylase, carboxyltransferase subunit beta [Oscillospiraceae bacterium]|jgi:acetyl-CoA carboxylase carboxyl transferase subunit beta|nr:acetyl-CoA carboxylase, carboxyltransferase subunit beta [Oscillospiraceae bacterium]